MFNICFNSSFLNDTCSRETYIEVALLSRGHKATYFILRESQNGYNVMYHTEYIQLALTRISSSNFYHGLLNRYGTPTCFTIYIIYYY